MGGPRSDAKRSGTPRPTPKISYEGSQKRVGLGWYKKVSLFEQKPMGSYMMCDSYIFQGDTLSAIRLNVTRDLIGPIMNQFLQL